MYKDCLLANLTVEVKLNSKLSVKVLDKSGNDKFNFFVPRNYALNFTDQAYLLAKVQAKRYARRYAIDGDYKIIALPSLNDDKMTFVIVFN